MKIKDRGFWVSILYKYLSVVYWFAYAIYFRTLTFFSVANPKIYLGGMLAERKSDIYSLLPDEYVPKTKLYKKDDPRSVEDVLSMMQFPLIFKPDVGYRGHMVQRLDSSAELEDVLNNNQSRDILIQEFLDENHEYSVMYYRVPGQSEYGVTSLVEKHLPKVVGDGSSSVSELINELNNPFINFSWVKQKVSHNLNRVLDIGVILVIDHVGNYARGSKFENLEWDIDPELLNSIHAFFKKVPGINFARLDVKANSLSELKKGKFRILEINGAKSEPIHIYDPNMSFMKIMKVISNHWSILFRVVKANIGMKNKPSSLEGIKSYRSLKRMMD